MSTQKAKDLRRLLSATKQQRQQQQQQQQEAASSSSSKITHPFAKYDTNNKLICVVCSVIIKNESFWNSHLVSLSHKESLRKLKEIKEKGDSTSKAALSINPTPKSILKKESSFNILEQESTITNNKKRSVGIEGKIRSSSTNVSSVASIDNSIKNLIGYGDEKEEENDSEEEEEEEEEPSRTKRVKYSDDLLTTEYVIEPIPQPSTIPSNSQMSVDEEGTSTTISKLPSDFFDTETSASVTNQQINDPTQETEIVQQQGSVLPDDFFDNSSLKHPSSSTKASASEIDEQEWINFQKEISKETQVSNQISNADDEQLQRDRDEMHEREQEFCLARLERLKNVAKRVKENRDKHMTVDNSKIKIKDDENTEDTDDDIDDDFVDGWMDWRAQKIL